MLQTGQTALAGSLARNLLQRLVWTAVPLAAALAVTGCAERMAGQVELLTVTSNKQLVRYNLAPPPPRVQPTPTWGDAVRSNDDIVTIQVESAYIQNLPPRLTGSNDVIIFADVWEDAAMSFDSASSLTTIVYVGPNQKVPGRLNFRDMLAYGPTRFKGHPLRIRFSMMVLQKRQAGQAATAIDFVSSLTSMAAPQYSAITSQVAKLLQGILRSQPDIKFFDFDVTFMSDAPETLAKVVPLQAQSRPPDASRTLASSPEDKDRPDGLHWLRYGRYALVETESYNRRHFVDGKVSDYSLQDGWLLRRDRPVATSYLVFRITPHQLEQDDEVLRAASDANLKLLRTLRNSPEEVGAAIKQIQDSSANLQNEVLRSRAEALAGRLSREADRRKPCSGKEALEKEFDPRWNDQIKSIDVQVVAQQIGAEVKSRWLDKYAGCAAAATLWLADSRNRETLQTDLAGKTVTVGGVPFTIERVSAVGQSGGGAAPFDTVDVALAVPAGTTTRVSRPAVEGEIARAASTIVNNSSPEKDAIRTVRITNADAPALKAIWAP